MEKSKTFDLLLKFFVNLMHNFASQNIDVNISQKSATIKAQTDWHSTVATN